MESIFKFDPKLILMEVYVIHTSWCGTSSKGGGMGSTPVFSMIYSVLLFSACF